MPTSLAFALLALSLAAPVSFAQSAGDDQYADPIVGDGGGEQPAPQPKPGGGGETDAPPVESPSTAAPAADSAATTSGESATLPRTGVDAWWFAAIGATLLAVGLLGRSRTGPRVQG